MGYELAKDSDFRRVKSELFTKNANLPSAMRLQRVVTPRLALLHPFTIFHQK